MKILFISPSPPNDMERVRTLNILKALKEQKHHITLVTLYNKKQEKYLKEQKYVDKIIKVKYSRIISIIYAGISLIFPIPIRVGYCFNIRLRKILKNMDKEYDIAYIKRLRMAQYKKYIKANKVYIDITDSLTKLYKRLMCEEKGIKKLLYIEEYLKHRYYETKICEKNKNIIICSEQDKKYIEDISEKTKGNIKVIENVVDTEKWKTEKVAVQEKNKRNKIVFCGVMSYEPNIIAVKYFIENVMPIIDGKYELYIIGPKCPKELKKLESKRIKFLGYVKSVKEELEKNDICVCPITVGAGVKNKILQASLVGLPIVSTTLGIEGINNEIKNSVFIADTAEEFKQQIEKINNLDNNKLLKIIKEQQEKIIKYNNLKNIINKII